MAPDACHVLICMLCTVLVALMDRQQRVPRSWPRYLLLTAGFWACLHVGLGCVSVPSPYSEPILVRGGWQRP